MESITSDLSQTRVLVEQITGPQDDMKIAVAQSAIDAIEQRFSRGEGLEHFDALLTIKALFKAKVQPPRSASSQSHHTPPISASPMRRSVDRSASSILSSPSLILRGREERQRLPGRLVLGSVNQYDDGTHPAGTFSRQYRVACPSTTLAFASRFLNHGTAGLDGGKIDQIIRTGQDKFLPLVENRARVLDGILAERIPEDPEKGRRLKGYLEGRLIPTARESRDKTVLGKIKVYGVDYEFDIQVKESTVALALRFGKTVLSTWEGNDLTDISETFAQEMLRQSRQIARDSDPVLQGNMMTPVDVNPAYRDYIGEKPRTPEAFFLASRPGDSQTLEDTRRDQIRQMIIRNILPLADFSTHKRVAAAITINGQILGIGLEKGERDQVTITLFDSHGKRRLHGQDEGYVYITQSADDAATTLLKMMKIESTEIEAKGLSKAQYEMIAASQEQRNEVSLWLALPRGECVPFLPEDAPLAPRALERAVERRDEVRRAEVRQDEEKKEAPPPRSSRTAVSSLSMEQFHVMEHRPATRGDGKNKEDNCIIS